MIINKNIAKKIFYNNRFNWGKRKIYKVSKSELEVLLISGAKIISIDTPYNGKNSYTIKYKKQLFVYSE